MTRLRAALLSACMLAAPFALAAGASAAQTLQPGMVLFNAAGIPMAVVEPLPPTPSEPTAWQRLFQAAPPREADLSGVFVQQSTIIRRMMNDMQSLDNMSMFNMSADRLIEAAMRQAQTSGVNVVVVSSFSSGNGSCSQTVTYTYPARPAQPQVAVRKIGDRCDALRSVPVATPTHKLVPPTGNLVRADYRRPVHAAPTQHS